MKVLLFFVAFSCASFSLSAEEIPEKTAFKLPTYKENLKDFSHTIPPIKKTPPINTEAIFKAVIRCYPSPSRFDISMKLQAGATLFDKNNSSIDGLSNRGNYYVGIVAEMPLLDNSATLERERQREYDRRKEVSAQVAKFVSALSKRNQAEREMGLYTALEKRATVRVQMGVVSVQEQIQYLEKVIASQQKITSSVAEITEARLALAGGCDDRKRKPLADFLRHIEQSGGD